MIQPMGDREGGKVRLDAWLWAARFFKTRSQAAAAVKAGKVAVDGIRAKPSQPVGPGRRVEITKGPYAFLVTVDAVGVRRGSAEQARALYTEDEDSAERREQTRLRLAAERMARPGRPAGAGRPTKKERRDLMSLWRRARDGQDEG